MVGRVPGPRRRRAGHAGVVDPRRRRPEHGRPAWPTSSATRWWPRWRWPTAGCTRRHPAADPVGPAARLQLRKALRLDGERWTRSSRADRPHVRAAGSGAWPSCPGCRSATSRSSPSDSCAGTRPAGRSSGAWSTSAGGPLVRLRHPHVPHHPRVPRPVPRLGALLPTPTTAAVLAGDMNLWGPPVSSYFRGWRRARHRADLAGPPAPQPARPRAGHPAGVGASTPGSAEFAGLRPPPGGGHPRPWRERPDRDRSAAGRATGRRVSVGSMTDALEPGSSRSTFTADGETRTVYRTGSGPAVIVMSEMPGITPTVAGFAAQGGRRRPHRGDAPPVRRRRPEPLARLHRLLARPGLHRQGVHRPGPRPDQPDHQLAPGPGRRRAPNGAAGPGWGRSGCASPGGSPWA